MENPTNVGNQNTQQIGQNPVSQPVLTPEKPKANYFVMGGIILVCFVLFGFGGYYFGKQSNKVQKTTRNDILPSGIVPQITATSTTYPTVNPTVFDKNFNTFKYNTFSFKYPKTWQLSENTTNSEFFTKNNIKDFEHMVLLQNGEYYLLIGIDSYQSGREIGGIFISDKDFQEYLNYHDEISIEGKKYFLRKKHGSLTKWNDPTREAGIAAIASLSEYVVNKNNLIYNGYDDYIQNKNGYSYMFVKFSSVDSDENTPAVIQTDIKAILESIKW